MEHGELYDNAFWWYLQKKSNLTRKSGQSITKRQYMEGDTVQKIVMYSNGKLANSSHLAEISKTNNNEARTAITSPISTIASLTPIERHSPVCQQRSDCSYKC
jgi:hypothetical protein